MEPELSGIITEAELDLCDTHIVRLEGQWGQDENGSNRPIPYQAYQLPAEKAKCMWPGCTNWATHRLVAFDVPAQTLPQPPTAPILPPTPPPAPPTKSPT